MSYTLYAAILTTIVSTFGSLLMVTSPEEKMQLFEYFMGNVPLSWLNDMPEFIQAAHLFSNAIFYIALFFVVLKAVRVHLIAGLCAAIAASVLIKFDIQFHEQFLKEIVRKILLKSPYSSPMFIHVLSFAIIGLPMVLRGAAIDVVLIFAHKPSS